MNFKKIAGNGYWGSLSILLVITYLLFEIRDIKAPKSVIESGIGLVHTVIDGDTIEIIDADNQRHRIRLVEIDAPEQSQMSGIKAKNALVNKIHGKEITVRYSERDSYGRILGKVYYQERWINREMIADGWAWHFRWYSDDRELALAEKAARKATRGLWKNKNPIPPWEYRRIASK